MPNQKAKTRKQQKIKLNKKWATEGRTARQHKKWLEKQNGESITRFGKR